MARCQPLEFIPDVFISRMIHLRLHRAAAAVGQTDTESGQDSCLLPVPRCQQRTVYLKYSPIKASLG